jgi:hypothetical protein
VNDLQSLALQVSPQPPVASRTGAPVRTQVWLSELERARWAAQPRYQGPQDLAKAERVDAATALEEVSTADSRGKHADQATVLSLSGHGAQLVLTDEAPSLLELSGAAHEEAPAAAASPTVMPAASGAASYSAARDRLSPPIEQAGAPTRHANAQWSTRSVHAHVGEQSTMVWIRDVGISPQQAVRLLERLQPVLGVDQSATERPIQLTVNGQTVEPRSFRSAHPINHQERKNGH